MKIIVAGGRNFDSYTLLETALNFYLARLQRNHIKIAILSGAARGADTLAEKYALTNGHSLERYPANWDRDGKSAGYKRNTLMSDKADALVAFWDTKSKGTKHMFDTAKQKGLRVRVVQY